MTAPHYIGELIVVYINGEKWRLEEDFGYQRRDGEIITARKDWITDFASIPWLFRRILPQAGAGPHGAYGKAAVIHDWMCEHPLKYSRREADDTFLEAMETSGVGYCTRYSMYWAVRLYARARGLYR